MKESCDLAMVTAGGGDWKGKQGEV